MCDEQIKNKIEKMALETIFQDIYQKPIYQKGTDRNHHALLPETLCCKHCGCGVVATAIPGFYSCFCCNALVRSKAVEFKQKMVA